MHAATTHFDLTGSHNCGCYRKVQASRPYRLGFSTLQPPAKPPHFGGGSFSDHKKKKEKEKKKVDCSEDYFRGRVISNFKFEETCCHKPKFIRKNGI